MRNRSADCDKAFAYYRRLAKVRTFVEENYAEPISLEDAAAVAGLEPKYFSAYFHRKTGTCFCAWLMHFRAGEAARRLGERDYSITDVALDCGFGDLRTFERSFKKIYLTTPAKYKSKIVSNLNNTETV